MSPVPASCRCGSGDDSGSCGVASHSSVVLCDPTSGNRILVVTTIPCVDGAPGEPEIEYVDPDSGIPVVPSGDLVVCGFDVTVDFPTEICDDLEAVRTTVCGVVSVDGTVCVESCGTPLDVNVTNSITIVDPVDVNVLNFPATQPVSIADPVCVVTCGDPLDVSVTGVVDVTLDEPIDVNVLNFPASVEISNDVGNPVPVSGTVTITDGSGPITVDGTVCISDCGGSITIDDGGGSITVDGTVNIGTMPEVEIKNDVGNPIPSRLADNAQLNDVSAWTQFVDEFVMVGGLVSGTGFGGVAAINPGSRAWLTLLTNSAGTEIGTNANPIQVGDAGGSLTVDGTVAVSNFPASTEIANDVGNPIPISATTAANIVTNPIFTRLTDGTNPFGTSGNPIFTSTGDTDLTTPTQSSVAASVTSVTIAALNTNRKQLSVYNDSALANMFLKLGNTASTTSFTVRLAPGSFYELPLGQHGSIYTGIVTAVWSVASGNARVTEITP